MPSPLILKFFSTAPVRADRLQAFAEATKDLFGKQRLAGEYTVNTADAVVAFDDIARFVRKLPDWTGCLTVVFGDGHGLSGRADLLRLHRKRAHSDRLGELAGYRAHEFTIEIQPAQRHEMSCSDLFAYFARAAEFLEAQFGLGDDDNGVLRSLHAPRGLAAGLPGVYRMTAFGSAFVDLIGADTLLRLSVPEVRRLVTGAIVLRVDDGLAQEVDASAKRDAIKAAIGFEYFANLAPAPLAVGGGQVSLWSFVGAVLRSKREAEAVDRLAKRLPILDWSGVYGDPEQP